MTTSQLLWLGYGDIATRSIPLLQQAGWQVTAACRQPQNKPQLPGVNLVAADASHEEDLRALLNCSFSSIVVTLTPAYAHADPYHQGYVIPARHLQHLLREVSPTPRLIYVSSTGVYGQSQGEWIDEDSPTEPRDINAKHLLQAEQLLQTSQAHVTLLRCSGIYGPGRDMLKRSILAGTAKITPAYSNRIHVDDVAGFIAHVLRLQQPQPCYLLSDDRPTPQAEIIAYYAAQLGVAPATLPHTDAIGPRGNKRCCNKRLRDSGYVLKYPDYHHA